MIMNNKTTQIIIGVILVAVSFYAGMKYGSLKAPLPTMGLRTENTNGGQGFRGGRGGNGATFGEILSKDANGITVKSQDGSSKIVLISASTNVSKQVTGLVTDLEIGKFVSVIGMPNQDGSITAQTIQLRPASTTPQRQN